MHRPGTLSEGEELQPHKGLVTALRSLLFNIIITDLFTKSIRKLAILCRKDNHEWINWYVAYVFRSHLWMHLSIRDGFYIQTKDLGDGAF